MHHDFEACLHGASLQTDAPPCALQHHNRTAWLSGIAAKDVARLMLARLKCSLCIPVDRGGCTCVGTTARRQSALFICVM
mmetsp:Transcript_124364/g.310949  ORF Transcript_124364/g.310949 Transcript_124364/m.310949 type:complete len:80 (+) Transcript_124364:765-1004(+)